MKCKQKIHIYFTQFRVYAKNLDTVQMRRQNVLCLTWFEPAFAVAVQWNHQNAPLHVIISFDANLWHPQMRFPTVIDRIDSAKKKQNQMPSNNLWRN